MTDRCPDCGAMYLLVGRRHNCRGAMRVKNPPQNILNKVKAGRPRIGSNNLTLKELKPWIKLGMSSRTWFRRQAEQRQKEKQ